MMDPSSKKEDHSDENKSINLEESYVIPSTITDSGMDGSQESEEELSDEFAYECHPSDVWKYAPERHYQELSYREPSESDCTISDEWQELNKSDYAKVIFSDLYYHADSGCVGCKFQITDNVHEDPCDFVGLFRIGYESLDQCLVSKMLSQTDCEEDGKLLRCDFSSEELPNIDAGFYQFLYITRDKEICGASMPFEIKLGHPRILSPDCIITEKGEDDFLLVRHSLEKKTQQLEELLAESQEKNRELNAAMETLSRERDDNFREKEIVIESLQKAMTALKDELATKSSTMSETSNTINILTEQIAALNTEMSVKEAMLCERNKVIKTMSQENNALLEKEKLGVQLQLENSRLSSELEKMKKIIAQNYDRSTFVEQLEDQKFMIKALEDSKQLALKEMNDLSESLSKRTAIINQLKQALGYCTIKVKALEDTLDMKADELENVKVELAECQEKLMLSQTEQEQTDELEKKKAELAVCQEKLEASLAFEQMKIEELEKLTKELNECKDQLEQSKFFGNELSEELSDVSNELEECKKEVRRFVEIRRRETAVSEERMKLIQQAVADSTQLWNDMSVSFPQVETTSVKLQLYQRKCELLAYKGKVKDILTLLEAVENAAKKKVTAKSGPCKVNKKCLKVIEDLQYVEEEDIAYINRLTEKINRRESGWLLQVDTGYAADLNMVVRDDLLRIERVINAVRCHLWNRDDWSDMIEGYDKEYADLQLELQIELVLAECRSQYQIQVLLERAGKDADEMQTQILDMQWKISFFNLKVKELKLKCAEVQEKLSEKEAEFSTLLSHMHCKKEKEINELKMQCEKLESIVAEKDIQASKVSDKSSDVQSKCMLLEEELHDLRTHYGELQSCLNEHSLTCEKLNDECMKKDALIEFLKTEKGNLSSKQVELQDTVKEHTARLTEAAELYKKQFKEIEKLKKLLRKIRREPYWPSTSSESQDPPVVVLNDESKTSSPVHEIFYPARSSSDSDTGEHVFGAGALRVNKEKHTKAHRSVRRSDEAGNQFKAGLTRTKKMGSDSNFSKHGWARTKKYPKDQVTQSPPVETTSVGTSTISEDELYTIPCPICNKGIYVTSTTTEPLIYHLETEHHTSMCPICGHFFEESIPKKYQMYHIEGHFNTKYAKSTPNRFTNPFRYKPTPN